MQLSDETINRIAEAVIQKLRHYENTKQGVKDLSRLSMEELEQWMKSE
jgi:uncharacterized protein YjiS (DUF1127 family)